jgi:hypothetical protein
LHVGGSLLIAQSNRVNDEWYRNSYRKLFFDYHNYEAVLNLASQFNAERWAEQLEQAHVQAVSLHSYCSHGWRYYRKGTIGYIHPGLPEGLDIVDEVMKACHKRNIRVIAYFNVLGGEPMDQHHPDWILTNEKGEKSPGIVSLFSPYFNEFLLPLLEEFASNYKVDGVFFDYLRVDTPDDRYAKQKFVRDTGKPYPVSSESPSWSDYIHWLLEEGKRLRLEAFNALHRGNPDVLTCVNWSYSYLQPEIPPDNVGFLSLDIEPEDQVFETSFIAKNWVTLDKPFDIMNTAFLQWWGDWGVKPAETMNQECAASMANGGRTWIGYQIRPEYFVENALMDEFRKTFKFVMEREDLCNGMVPVPDIAILNSSAGLFTHGTTLHLYNEDLQSLRGAFKMLMESGLHFNILNEEVLLKNIDQYNVVILPDQRYISGELANALRRFVQNGGSVIATVLTATQDNTFKSTKEYLLGDLFGIKLDGLYIYDHSYILLKDERLKADVLDMAHQAYGECALIQATSAKVLADLWEPLLMKDGQYIHLSSPPGKYTGHPAITLNTYGKGKAVFLSNDIFYAYAHRSQWNLKNLFKNLLMTIDPKRLIEMNAPGVVEVVLARKDKSTQVHLVNHYREKALGGAATIVEHVLPVSDIDIKVRMGSAPASVTQQPEGIKLEWKFSDGYLSFRVPKLEIYSIVVIE